LATVEAAEALSFDGVWPAERHFAAPGGAAPVSSIVHTRVVFGTPARVTERLSTLRQEVGLSGIIMDPNIGGRIPYELLLRSMRLFTQEVAPSLR
jgi:alkanesulfonate monooxygenase SsuD/methylene tetrahydromethanopterin reductase-like flavin-dependent oxidoreductase (luciferase family)